MSVIISNKDGRTEAYEIITTKQIRMFNCIRFENYAGILQHLSLYSLWFDTQTLYKIYTIQSISYGLKFKNS